MEYKNLLKEFMKWENAKITNIFLKNKIEKFPILYSHKDFEDFDSWSELQAKKVFTLIEEHVNLLSETEFGLTPALNPYCLKLSEETVNPCLIKCAYARRNGSCTPYNLKDKRVKKDKYFDITRLLFENGINPYKLFTGNELQEFFKEIKNEIKP